jgi:hypothetical protein
MRRYITGAAIAALIATPLSTEVAFAQAQATPAAPMQQSVAMPAAPAPTIAADGTLTLGSGTPITLAVSQEVNSSTHHAGDTFALTVLNDVRIGDTVVIPRGTPAQALITWRTGKGAFGKSGKIEFSLTHIELNGQRIPVTGSFRQEGEGNTIATGVGIIAIGVFAGFITGKRARLPVGRELMAQLAQPVSFTPAGALSPGYDGNAAWAAAEAATPMGQCRAAARALTDQHAQERAGRACFRERLD